MGFRKCPGLGSVTKWSPCSSTIQSEIGTVFLTILFIHYSLNNSGVMYLHELHELYLALVEKFTTQRF